MVFHAFDTIPFTPILPPLSAFLPSPASNGTVIACLVINLLVCVVYLDEAGCWVPPLLKVFLSVLLLYLQGKAWAQDTLYTHIHTMDWICGSWHRVWWINFKLCVCVCVVVCVSRQAGRRRRSPSEQSQLRSDDPSTSEESCLRSRWLSEWSRHTHHHHRVQKSQYNSYTVPPTAPQDAQKNWIIHHYSRPVFPKCRFVVFR